METQRNPKQRLDELLVSRNLVVNRSRAQGLIRAGKVLVDDFPQDKPGYLARTDSAIRLKTPDHPYVSRGGLKLHAALEAFEISAHRRIALDIGASTGGFTDVLLRDGASKVYAVDVGWGQLAWSLRTDPRVKVLERTNARELTREHVPDKADCVVIDVSFISIGKILPTLISLASEEADWITLIKPQFEAGRQWVQKGGIVRDPKAWEEAIEQVTRAAQTHGLNRVALIESPIKGADGNKEFLAHWKSAPRH